MPKLGVNIDHIATLRQARGTTYPDPVRAALLAEEAGDRTVLLEEANRLKEVLSRKEVVWVPLKHKLDTAAKENIQGISQVLKIIQASTPF